MAKSGGGEEGIGALRRTLGTFVTGVTIVTTIGDDEAPWGLTANSFTSVSLDPPLVLVCIARTAGSCPAFLAARGFAVNILSDAQQALSARFASKRPDKFAGVSYRFGATGAPIIEGSLAWLDCAVRQRIEAGDHIILIGEVLAFERSARRPLAYCQGSYLPLGRYDETQARETANDGSSVAGPRNLARRN
jgi:flavin reductase (DIM6/NTAB) family NADH-FMN oxidoreductase RutF